MPDTNLGPRWRHLAAVIRGERATQKAARKALHALLLYAGATLRDAGYDASVLSAEASGWRTSSSLAELLGEVESTFMLAWGRAERAEVDATAYAVRHVEAVTNRLAGIPDETFDTFRLHIAEGFAAGESIPQIAARVDALLGDEERWTNRAVTIARTETVGAANAGARGAAAASAQLLGYADEDVVKEWLSTGDDRTRETHLEADGQQVMGLDTPFTVGSSDLDVPGDPFGDPGETVNCRCTVLFHYPGDPGYPADGITPTASRAETRALAPSDPLAAAHDTTPVEAPAEQLEEPTDPGPQTDQERMARAATLDELVMETKRGSAGAKAVARAELTRRGFPGVASGRIKAARAAGLETTMDHLTAALPSDADEPHTGVLVVALPAADDPVQGIGPETKHATLLFYGDEDVVTQEADGVTGYGPDFRTVLESTVAGYAAITAPFTEQVTGVESLGDNGARVWMLDREGQLAHIVGDLPDYESEVTPPPSEYPEYLPHVTIGYPDPEVPEEADGTGLVPELEEAAAAVTSITFDRLAVWWAGEQTEWPLGGTDQEDDMDEPTETETTGLAAAQDAIRAAMADRAPALVEAALAAIDAAFAEAGDPPEAAPGTPALAQDIPADGEPFYGILWPEGVMSGDARGIDAGATTWRDLPLPLMAQDATAMGHDGAVRVGRIDTITRDDTTYSVPVVRYAGVWDTSPAALETSRQVGTGVLRGVSVDGDAVTVELRGSDGSTLDPMVDDFPEDGVVVEVATEARVSGATACSIPAFHQAYVANGRLEDRTDPEPGWNADGTPKDAPLTGDAPNAEGMEADEGVAASAAPAWTLTAAAVPTWSIEDFANPGLTEPTRLTITDDGRVYGHLATWGVCHIGIDGICQEPPASATNYAYFATGSVQLDSGQFLPVGQLTMGTGHAAMGLRARPAAEHYDNTGSAVADVAMGQDGVGIWFAGRLRPGTTAEQVYAMRAAGSVSGDWREVGGSLELVAALVVNVPGFPIPAPAVAASGAGATAMVASGVVRRAAATEQGQQTLLTFAEVRREALAAVDRSRRAERAWGRVQEGRVATARRRLAAAATRDRAQRVAAAAARIGE